MFSTVNFHRKISICADAENIPVKKPNFKNFLEEFHKIYPSAAIFTVVEPYASQRSTIVADKLPKLLPDFFDAKFDNCTLEELSNEPVDFSVTKEEKENVERLTRNQSCTSSWFKFRAGRITASQFKTACRTKIEEPSKTLVKQICYPMKQSFTSKYTEYGKKYEKNAIKKFFWNIQNVDKSHSDFAVYSTGFFISLETPEVGASPDSICRCSCCGWAALEVKCPYWMKDMKSLDEVVEFVGQNVTCLVLVDNKLRLDVNHAYYFQVQLQMYVCKFKFCDFFVWSKDMYLYERIPYNENFLMLELKKALKFHKMVIKPELLSRYYTDKVFSNPKSKK